MDKTVICEVSVPAVPPGQSQRLKIVRAEGRPGVSLLYCDSGGREFDDAPHASLAAAMQQAYFQFGVAEEQWEFVPET